MYFTNRAFNITLDVNFGYLTVIVTSGNQSLGTVDVRSKGVLSIAEHTSDHQTLFGGHNST